jgi:hypothetical protein
MGRIDNVKTWANSKRYTLSKLKNEKEKIYNETKELKVKGHKIYPKPINSDKVIRVNTIDIVDEELYKNYQKKKEARQIKLNEKSVDNVKHNNEKDLTVSEKIRKLKEELARLSAKEAEEKEKESHRSR